MLKTKNGKTKYKGSGREILKDFYNIKKELRKMFPEQLLAESKNEDKKEI